MKQEGYDENAPMDNGEVEIMPTIELVEYERTAYIKGMEEYLVLPYTFFVNLLQYSFSVDFLSVNSISHFL